MFGGHGGLIQDEKTAYRHEMENCDLLSHDMLSHMIFMMYILLLLTDFELSSHYI